MCAENTNKETMQSLLYALPIALVLQNCFSLAQANEYKDYIGVKVQHDKAVVTLGKVSDVALARTGAGELTIHASKILVGEKKIDLLKALSSGGSSGGQPPCKPVSSKLLQVKSCQASSEHDSNYKCMNAFDQILEDGGGKSWATKGQGVNSWIKADFFKLTTVTSFNYMQRNCQCEHNNRIRLEFSDGSSQTFDLKKDNSLQTLRLSKPVKTTYAKIVVVSVHATVNNGANEIQFFGHVGDPCTALDACLIKNKLGSTAQIPNTAYDTKRHTAIKYLKELGKGTSEALGKKSDDQLAGLCPGAKTCKEKSPAKLKVISCSASTEHDSNYKCDNAFNGIHQDGGGKAWATKGEGVGSWIRGNFGKKYTVTKFQYMQRGCNCEHNRGIRLSFSDGTYQDFELKKDNSLQTLALKKPVSTYYVLIKVLTQWSKVNNGANEIVFHGFEGESCASGAYLYPPPVTKPTGTPCTPKKPTRVKVTSCSASSEHDSNYKCGNAFNGINQDGGGKSWATKGEGVGSWIKANFAKITVVKFRYMQRGCACEHNNRIRLEFSDGSKQYYNLKKDNSFQEFMLQSPVTTTFVKIVVESHHAKVNNGANEIEFFGQNGPGCTATDACLVRNGWSAANSLATMARTDKRNTLIFQLNLLGKGQVSTLKTKTDDQLAAQCPGAPKCVTPATVLLKVASCSASTEHDSNYKCINAFNGIHQDGGGKAWATRSQGAGSWITANFGKAVTITNFKYMQRGCSCEHNKDIRLHFSDGSYQDHTLNKDNSLQSFKLKKPVTTTFVKLDVRSVWATVNNGANEIQYFGYAGSGCANGDYLYKGRRMLQNLLSSGDDSTLQVIAKLEKQNADLLVQNAMLNAMVKRMCAKLFPDEACELSF